MDKFMSLTQLVMSVVMFLCIIVWGIAHLIMGTINLFGFLVVLSAAFLIWVLVCESYREYQQEKKQVSVCY